jgi:HAD superfamily hydrolase (TIGR01509 family)
MKQRPAAVVFDMDGLLFDSEILYRDAILGAARDLGYAFTVEDFLKLVGLPASVNRAMLRAQFGEIDLEAFEAAWMRNYRAIKATVALKAGVGEILDRLDALRIPRAICTSSSHTDVAHNLGLHGLVGRFDAIVAAGDYVRGKPEPDPYLRAAEQLGMPPGACLALEDSHNGVRSAAAAGMRVVMVPDLLPATEEIRRLCQWVALDLHEVRVHLLP